METPFSFAPKNDMTVAEAEEVFEKYYASKPRVKQFIEETQEQAKKDGYVETLQGHRRLIQDIFSTNKKTFNGAIRKTVNTKIQGTGAYLTNYSLALIDDYLRINNMRSKIVVTVHDSIVVDMAPEEIERVSHAVKTIMENLPIDFLYIEWQGETIRFPIKADLEIGVNYNDMVDFDLDELKQFKTVKGYADYHWALKTVKNYKNSGKLDDAQYEACVQDIKNKIDTYKSI